ncbi:MAG: PQQ-dependent catabolism-associated CXXCW motif protein [Alphaproteobacteria bacterium]|nr:PQQ-dependent catabolism-associated CXXCW motif protein [Rhizobiaceae bacterium]MBU3960284.1 PQQ-dependent catabolism-associated CXXCW motif protein [Alphaproteobacteria bacterium]MBU4048613.1 PQQ-dependent catabolism-associated CXXCW motif protein [Alphaproteobacteria bacterium]MBU4088942.1 PQQ-dependent catabolism-associated CXXCW motif protein [Alphaproteobacteria bacterium]MBU4157902.1 PQQ-dependent catabolism-associated CXXCW motif protein [Alphaproteobacteria bacterium]
MNPRRLLLLVLLLLVPTGLTAEEAPEPQAGAVRQTVEEPGTYREDEYRAPVPATLAGATVVSTAEAHALWESGGAAFIDVLPRPPKPANLPEGTVWNEKPRISIERAIWLPNTGYGKLADPTLAYFRNGLEKATGGDQTKPLLFFCLPDCWMSWNAAKRALELGYGKVYWYPEGSEGWAAAGYPTVRLQPEPGADQ